MPKVPPGAAEDAGRGDRAGGPGGGCTGRRLASCWNLWTLPLTEFQQEFLRNCSTAGTRVKTGATRSGKTYLDCAVTIPKRICAARTRAFASCWATPSARWNAIELGPCGPSGVRLVGVVRTSPSGNIVQLFGQQSVRAGLPTTKKTLPAFRAQPSRYAYGDGDHHMGRRCISDAESRLSCPHSHFDGTATRIIPQHWFKQFLDSDADIYRQAYTIDDKPTLPPEFVAQLKKDYAGTVYYNRLSSAGGLQRAVSSTGPFADNIAAGDGAFPLACGQTPPPVAHPHRGWTSAATAPARIRGYRHSALLRGGRGSGIRPHRPEESGCRLPRRAAH